MTARLTSARWSWHCSPSSKSMNTISPTLAREEEMIVAALTQAADIGVAPRVVDSSIDSLGEYLYIGGHWALGMPLLTLQLAIRREVGNRAGEGVTLNNLGNLVGEPGTHG